MARQLELTERFKENWKRLPSRIQKQAKKKIELFVNNPQHPSLNIHKYKTNKKPECWEAYINKSYRFTFEITKDSYILRNIGPHSIIDKGQV